MKTLTTQATPPQSWHVESDDTPWTFGDAETAANLGEPFGETEILFSIRNDDGDLIALCPWEPLAAPERQAELRQNAQRIAAMPVMLAACKLLVCEMDRDDWDGQTVRQIAIDARTAIAKAKGDAT